MKLDPPPKLTATADLDGWRFALRGEHPRRRAFNALTFLLAAGLAFAAITTWPESIGLVVAYVVLGAWLVLTVGLTLLPTSPEVEVLLHRHGLVVRSYGVELDRVPLIDVGVVVIAEGRFPTLDIQRANGSPLHVPMHHEPRLHAEWLARTIEAAARDARATGGHAGDVPPELLLR